MSNITQRASSSCQSGEAEIRSALLLYLRTRHIHEPDTIVLKELGLLRRFARADVAVVNGILHGYEIKSDRDSLRRLNRQIPVYNNIFDRVTLVVGQRHGKGIDKVVPEWWEILDITGHGADVHLACRRPGGYNKQRSARALVELLWLDASLKLLDAHGGTKGYRSRSRCEVWDRLCEVCTIDEISAAVRAALKTRPVRGFALRLV
jgi:hypothetical protein